MLGWKEFELEVMRDLADNVVIICSIENVDPMGVHTGDSITVAPQQTLTDKEYQRLRDASIAIIREMGVECGGSNVQLATDPATGDLWIGLETSMTAISSQQVQRICSVVSCSLSICVVPRQTERS